MFTYIYNPCVMDTFNNTAITEDITFTSLLIYPIKYAIVQLGQRWSNEIGIVTLHNVFPLLFYLCYVSCFRLMCMCCRASIKVIIKKNIPRRHTTVHHCDTNGDVIVFII